MANSVTHQNPSLNNAPWGKTDQSTTAKHHLAHHSADVAVCFEAITSLPVFRSRLEQAAEQTLSDVVVARLVVLAFLHDVGKLHPGFQAKGWPEGVWQDPLHGHVNEGAAIFFWQGLEHIARALHCADMLAWGLSPDLLLASFAHHGQPFAENTVGRNHWRTVKTAGWSYDPAPAAAEIGAMMRRWFATAFVTTPCHLPTKPAFQHLFNGLVSLADWLGSDRQFFPFVGPLDKTYIETARKKAGRAVTSIGLDVERLRPGITGRTDFLSATGCATPNKQQGLIGSCPTTEHLIILEAETGSGKTEAALWRFARLFEAGAVDSLYFALPTRAAAVQIHGRVNRMAQAFFRSDAPEAILAVPGYMRAGEVEGVSLPDWRVRWDDEGQSAEDRLAARWPAESAKRYLAAMMAVGTVDQAMLAALQVKHAHLRGAALSRSLLVIDEVHASDRYMTEVQNHLLKLHVGRGGYAMLMSATLGSRARLRWLGRKAMLSFAEAVNAPYPAVWGKTLSDPLHDASSSSRQKLVSMTLVPTMAAIEVAQRAIRAAKSGARVLVIRNTVDMAVDTWTAVRASGGESLLLRVADGPALHHGRFAPEDRKILDLAVEAALSPRERNPGGVIVIGTMTLEQSLDIDADLLLTDLCPVDVLLQRIGRLHRHTSLPRPPGFATSACYVFVPEKGLAPLLKPAFENGLGAVWKESGSLNGIYRDVSMLELTRRLVVDHPVWEIPAMNRLLVESATHDEKIEALHQELGKEWAAYGNNILGSDIAKAGAARLVALPVDGPFGDLKYPGNEEDIRTRLSDEGVRITFAEPVMGPFGAMISGATLPAHWLRGVDPREHINCLIQNGIIRFTHGTATFRYDRCGLRRE